MKYLMFDTNAFYNYVGRENIAPEFVSAIPLNFSLFRTECGMQKKAINNLSFLEMITLFKDNRKALKNILNLLDEHKFSVDSLSTFKITRELRQSLSNAIEKNDNDQYSRLIHIIIVEKSHLEANWTYTFASQIAWIYAQILSESMDEASKRQFLNLYSSFVLEKIDRDKEDISCSLIDSYNNSTFGDTLVKADAKCSFYEYVFRYSLTACALLECYKHFALTEENSIPLDDLKKEVIKYIPEETEEEKKKIREILIHKFQEDVGFYKLKLQETVDQFHKVGNGLSAIQVKYIEMLFDKMFKVDSVEQSKDFQKNDIIDMLFLGTVSEKMKESYKKVYPDMKTEDMYLITFDDKIRVFLDSERKFNGDYIKAFYI